MIDIVALAKQRIANSLYIVQLNDHKRKKVKTSFVSLTDERSQDVWQYDVMEKNIFFL